MLQDSIEVYPIATSHAVQMGFHRFYDLEAKGSPPSRFSKFVHIWKREDGQWRLSHQPALGPSASRLVTAR